MQMPEAVMPAAEQAQIAQFVAPSLRARRDVIDLEIVSSLAAAS
jgi:hypothetical protein